MTFITNAKIVLEDSIITDGVLVVDGTKIVNYGKKGELPIPDNAEIIDAEGLYVGPGFVDIHVHGGGGHEFLKEPIEAAEFFLDHGTTTLLAASRNVYDLDFYLESYDRVRRAMKQGGAGKCIYGIYMEGPFMNPNYGANPERNLWRGYIDPNRYMPLADGCADIVKVWAVAPEREGLEPFMAYAKKVNPQVIFAVGHSEASYEQIDALKHYGITIQTHCMNATGCPEVKKGVRSCGPDEYCFLNDDMFAELISDSGGVHVCSNLQRLLLKIKGLDKVILITDGNAVDFKAPPELEKFTDLSFDPFGRLAGSRLTMNKACKNIMNHTGISVREAFLLGSRNPAKAIGIDSKVGTISKGKIANLVFVNDEFDVKKVMLEGQLWK